MHDFLAYQNPDAAQRAVKTIRQQVRHLAKHPEIGRTIEEMPHEFRELVVDFGNGAYLELYRTDGDVIVSVAVRHGREVGY